jgi:hypothetical protein
MIYDNDALDEARAERRCSMGVGCGTAGVCYAKAHGRPEECPNAQIIGATWWRLEAGREDEHSGVRLEWLEYRVIRVTPRGVWLMPCAIYAANRRPRFALIRSCRWASPTKDGAAAGFVARKRRQIAICRSQIDDAEEAMALVREWSAS